MQARRKQMGRLVRIGFIGCGNHASQNLYPALRLGVNGSPALKEPSGELVACCDLDEGRAQRNARVFGFAHWYTDYRTMLEREDLDCLFAVMHPRQQPAIAIDCLNAGKPVFVEKPPTETLEDAYCGQGRVRALRQVRDDRLHEALLETVPACAEPDATPRIRPADDVRSALQLWPVCGP